MDGTTNNNLPVSMIEVKKDQLEQVLRERDILLKQNAELREDLAKVMITTIFMSKMLDFEKGMLTAIANFTRLITKPKAFIKVVEPVFTVVEKYPALKKQIEDEIDKKMKS